MVFREPVTGADGLPTRAWRSRQESYPTREQAQARCDELNYARHSIGGPTAVAEQRRRVAEGTLKVGTYDNYETVLGHYVLPVFGGKAIGAVTLVDCEQFRADLASRLARRTVNNVWQPFAAVFRYAIRANTILASPADAIDRTATTVICHGDGTTGSPAGRDHLFGSGA